MPQHIGHKTARRVLIVEDVPRFREMLLRTVRDMDFVPRGVEGWEEGLREQEEEPVEIALVDLGLPGMSGLEFCEKVRKKWHDIQLIILTGYGDLDAAKQAIRLDVVDFLTKPCEHSEMEVALDRALRRSQQLTDEVNINADTLESVEEAQALASRIAEVHIKDATHEAIVPLGQGDVDVAAVINALSACGYDGYYAFETSLQRDPQEALARALASAKQQPA